MIKKTRQSFLQKHIWKLLLLLLLIIPLFDLFHFGFPLTHDGHDHIARIANFYESLKDGVVVPRWAENLNWGYGHPILMFLYPLSSYSASLFHFLGFSLTDSTKLVFGISYVLSGFFMYLWIRSFLDRKSAFFAAILYSFAPYRFIDFYVRGAIGEHVGFIFPPLICYFLYKLSKKYSPWSFLGGTVSIAGLLLSHNMMSVMFLPIVTLYGLFLILIHKQKYKISISYLGMLTLGLGLSSFFWIPAVFEAKYTLRDIIIKGGYAKNFIEPINLLYGPWNYNGSGVFSIQIGIFNLLSLLVAPFIAIYFWKKGNKSSLIILILLVISAASVFLMVKESSFIWQKILLLQSFQFPWRFLSVLVFTTSVCGAFLISVLPKKISSVLLILLIITVVFLNRDYWRAKGFFYHPDSFYEKIFYGTTDTGECGPIWSVRFMEKEPKAHIEVISGSAKITELERSSVLHTYIVTAEKESRIRENTLYFPGWEVKVNQKTVSVEFQDQLNRGLITFFVPQGKNEVTISFHETKLRSMADILSVASALSLCAILIVGQKRGKHEKR